MCLRFRSLELADLTDPASRGALGVSGGPAAFLDPVVARGIARTLRRDPGWTGLIVPSMAFLDDVTRCNLVLFPERLPDGIRGIVDSCEETGRLLIERPPHDPR